MPYLNRAHRIVVAAFLAAVLSSGLVAVSAPSASAATCTSRGCGMQDPNNEGCTASSSITKTFTSGAAVATEVNEYSTVCNANWVFAYENTAAQNAGWTLFLDINTTDSIRAYEDMCSANPIRETDTGSQDLLETACSAYGGTNGWPMWTDMVDGTHKSYATMTVRNRPGSVIATVPDPQ